MDQVQMRNDYDDADDYDQDSEFTASIGRTNRAEEESDDDIVITGISGVFPSSRNLEELELNLRSKRNLISNLGDKRSTLGVGKIPNVEKFDAAYFGLRSDVADTMDPMGRLLLEKTYETIVDSGYNPLSFRGGNVGVFIGVYLSETEAAFFGGGSADGLSVIGIGRCFLANRISYCFDFHGPSLCVDTACSSSMKALHLARQAIQNGDCDAAIVGGCNLCLNNGFTLHLQKLGIVSTEGVARVLDEAGHNYCRSETVCTILLQKRKHARRIYATLIHTKVNCDGYKAEGITYPSFVMQKRLLSDFYCECKVQPCAVDWLELHATGTRAGDREEIKSVSVFCENRASSLKVGSIRSNMGHSEAASTLCSIAKVIIAMRSGLIPPNINYTTPRNDIQALHNGSVQVITEDTPWDNGATAGLVGINSFGLGGANGHALLRSFKKSKRHASRSRNHALPVLVAVSGRTREAVDLLLTELERNPIDDEFVSLLHEIHSQDIVQHLYRGAIILHDDENATRSTTAKVAAQNTIFKEITHSAIRQRPVWLVFSGVGSQWPGMAKQLMRLPTFADSIAQCDRILQPFNVNLIRIVSEDDPALLQNVVNCFVGITAIQIAFVDVLRTLNVSAAGIIGHSAGEIACAYADNCLTREQTILCAYYRGVSCAETQKQLPNGAMAAIGLGYDELKAELPDEVDIACRNSESNCTISGAAQAVNQVVDKLGEKKIFVRRIDSLNMAFHSRHMKKVTPKLLQHLKKVIPEPRARSNKWISTSVCETFLERNGQVQVQGKGKGKGKGKGNGDSEGDDESKYCSAQYMTNNMVNPVFFEQASRTIAQNAIVIEVSAHSLLRAIMKQTCGPEHTYIALDVKQSSDSLQYFLQSIAKLFLSGETLKFQNLYPLVSYPVSKETRMIAPLVKWQHDRDWDVVFSKKEDMIAGERRYVFNAKMKELDYIFDHVIDGRHIVPGYIYLLPIWETVPLMYNRLRNDTSIVFENLRFQRMVNVYHDKPLSVLVHIQKGSGNFEIVENNQLVLSGRVYVPEDVESEMMQLPVRQLEEDADADVDLPLEQDDIYKELQLRGYGYKNLFRQMLRSNLNGSRARVKWNGNWITFLDTISQTYILKNDTRYPCLLTGVDKLVVDVDKHNAIVRQNVEFLEKGIPVHVDEKLGIIQAGGVQIRGVKGHIIPKRRLQEEPRLLVYKFFPYVNHTDESDKAALFAFYARLMWDNIHAFSSNLQILEYECSHSNRAYYSTDICQGLDNYPHMQVNVVVVCSADDATAEKNLTDHVNGKFTFVRDSPEQLNLQTDAHLLIAEYDDQLQNKVSRYLAEFGFFIVRFRYENMAKLPAAPAWLGSFVSCGEHRLDGEKLVVYRRRDVGTLTESLCLKVTPTFEWLNQFKEALKNENKRIVLYAQGDPITGLQGFFNCLARETSCKNIKCFVILDDDAIPFSSDEPFYQQQMSKNVLVNVYKNRSWGCYAHFPISPMAPIKTPYAFVNVGVTGDLRTLNWFRGNIVDAAKPSATSVDYNRKCDGDNDNVDFELVHVFYSALNFKDVLLATGILSYEAFVPNRLLQECMIGCEFSGKNAQGKRYMGIHPAGAICTMLLASNQFLWQVPDEWSLEEAATVPIAYLTTIAAFFVHGNLKKGESVLIHSGAGGVGQAAINIATYYECEIFTTVGTAEKKEFIKKHFPHIKENHIGRSRDCSFEQMVMTETEGKGVDVVLNSLAGDKLLASVRCLAKGGRFLEIGKLDLLKDNPLGMNIFLRGVSFHCVLLDKIHEEKPEMRKKILSNYERELKAGSIKPIVRTVFEADDVESAFRYMSSGKHIGKVLLKIRDHRDDSESPPNILYKDAMPRFNCHSEKVYIICGGLGGMGLELADWLVLRGAKKLMLTSRKGVTNGYQKLRINLWKSYGVTVAIRTDDVSKTDHVRRLLREAENLGSVDAIFNLAAVIDDRLLENQDSGTLEKVIAPKKTGTRLLDELSSEICPQLERFVVFSTLSCSYGNAGQTNYGFANACCERICEKRKERGLHALAVQWGAVDEVGMLTRTQMDMEKTCNLVGLIPQPIRSCLKTMDVFLAQTETIVSSFILVDKSCGDVGNKAANNLLQTVANILGIKDTNSVSAYSPLPELGMDSISGLEVKQTLEQQYDLFLSPRELMSLTFATLEEIQKTGKKSSITKKDDTNIMASVPHLRNALFDKAKQHLLLESTLLVSLPSVSTTLMSQSQVERRRRIIFCFPPIDGTADALEPLSKNLSHQLLCFQYVAIKDVVTIAAQAETFASHIFERLNANEPFNIIAYSYGVIIAMETVKILQNKGATKGNVVLVDGSLKYAKVLRTLHFGGLDDVAQVETKIIRDIASCYQPTINNEIFENDLNRLDCWQSKLDYMTSKMNSSSSSTTDIETLLFVANYLYRKYTSTMEYHFETSQKFDARLAIIRAKKMVVPMPADTGLNMFFARTPEEFYVDENHFSILRSEKSAEIIQNFFEE